MNTFSPLLALAASGSTLTGLDWLMIAAYFTVLLGVAWWVISRGKDTADDYFLAGRNLGWWVVGASIFASNIGSEHVVGLAGSGAADGVALAHYELHAWCLLVLAWVFVPFYARSLVFTMPEFLERRFSPPSRYVLSIVSLITFVVSKIAVGIFAGGVVFSTLLPEVHLNVAGHEINSFWIGSVMVIVLTGLYTILGGMRAVAYNDAVQVIVLITGSALLTIYGLVKLGGWHELREVCGSDMFNLWKPLIPKGVEGTWAPVLEKNAAGELVREAWYFNGAFPWLGMAICAPVIGLWYWCTDQYIVQRALGAPNEQTARRGSIFAAFLKLFPVYLFIIPGLICFALAKSDKVPGLGRSPTFYSDDVQDPTALAGRLKRGEDELSRFLWSQLAEPTRELLTQAAAGQGDAQAVKLALAEDLNKIIQGDVIYTEARFAGVKIWSEAKGLLAKPPAGQGRARLNRVLIEDAYPAEIVANPRLIAPDGKAVAHECQSAFPLMVKYLLPPGIRGVVVAGLLSALMGSLAGVFNACSTLFTVDLYEKWKPQATQHQLVRTGRIATAVMVVIALAWIPVIQGAHGLYNYLQAVQGYLAPPIFVVFFFGVFFKRLNAQGCFWAMVVGFIVGLFRMLVDTPVTLGLFGRDAAGAANGYAEGSFLWIVNNINFQYFSILITIISAIVMVVVSYLTPQPNYAKIANLTYGTVTDEHRSQSRSSWNWIDVAGSCAIVAAIIGAYLYFTG